jgi:hypothetical protein
LISGKAYFHRDGVDNVEEELQGLGEGVFVEVGDRLDLSVGVRTLRTSDQLLKQGLVRMVGQEDGQDGMSERKQIEDSDLRYGWENQLRGTVKMLM